MDEHRKASVEDLPTLWGLHLAVGIVAAGIGTAILVWPDATRTVIRVFFGSSFIVSGVVWVVQGFRSSLMKSGAYILLGLLAIGVGVFVLAYGQATVVLLTFLLGFALLFRGTLLIARRMLQPRPPGSGPPVVEILRAVTEFALGLALVVWPGKTLSVLRVGLAIVLYLWALGEIVLGIALQRQSRREPVMGQRASPSSLHRNPERA